MAIAGVRVVEEPERVRVALSAPRRQLLERLREPASAVQLAAEFGLARQRVNYHLRLLEQSGLIELVEARKRRGCVERVMRATATSFLVDPDVMTPGVPNRADPLTAAADRFSAAHLAAVAADTVRTVGRMRAAAEEEGTRLLTFSIESEVRFAAPGDVHRFTDALLAAIARTVAEFDSPGGRPYRVIVAGHPAPATSPSTVEEQ